MLIYDEIVDVVEMGVLSIVGVVVWTGSTSVMSAWMLSEKYIVLNCRVTVC